jgi:hypothetical protein
MVSSNGIERNGRCELAMTVIVGIYSKNRCARPSQETYVLKTGSNSSTPFPHACGEASETHGHAYGAGRREPGPAGRRAQP